MGYFIRGSSRIFVQNRFWEGALELQNLLASENMRCTSIVARVWLLHARGSPGDGILFTARVYTFARLWSRPR